MRRAVPPRPTLAVFLLLTLLTACGFVTGRPTVVRTGVTGPAVDGVRITSMTVFSGWHPPCPDVADLTPDPLPTGDPGIFADYEVTNSAAEALTYTIRFDFTTDVRAAVTSRYQTVRSVGPGGAVRGTVRLGVLERETCPVTGVRVAEVTKVPAGEAPPASGECSPSGVRLALGDLTAAAGRRAADLLLENCGTGDYTLDADGAPLLELLGKDRSPVEGVQILRDGGSVPEPGFDEPAGPLVLRPGESAVSSLTWRSTTELGPAPVDVPYVRVRARQGADPVTLTLRVDLGTTGELAVSSWRRRPV